MKNLKRVSDIDLLREIGSRGYSVFKKQDLE